MFSSRNVVDMLLPSVSLYSPALIFLLRPSLDIRLVLLAKLHNFIIFPWMRFLYQSVLIPFFHIMTGVWREEHVLSAVICSWAFDECLDKAVKSPDGCHYLWAWQSVDAWLVVCHCWEGKEKIVIVISCAREKVGRLGLLEKIRVR